MKGILSLAAVAAAAAAGAAWAAAPDHEGPLKALVADTLRAEVATPAMVAAVRAQNAEHAGVAQSEIDGMDAAWRAEVDAGGGPITSRVLGTEASAALRAVQARHGGLLTEIFVMDAVGLVVGESDMTSDYWQGDEDKWSKTYPVGPDAMFVDAIELDESTQTLQSQVSFTLVDPETGEAVGAVTAGVNVEMLFQ